MITSPAGTDAASKEVFAKLAANAVSVIDTVPSFIWPP